MCSCRFCDANTGANTVCGIYTMARRWYILQREIAVGATLNGCQLSWQQDLRLCRLCVNIAWNRIKYVRLHISAEDRWTNMNTPRLIQYHTAKINKISYMRCSFCQRVSKSCWRAKGEVQNIHFPAVSENSWVPDESSNKWSHCHTKLQGQEEATKLNTLLSRMWKHRKLHKGLLPSNIIDKTMLKRR